MKFILRHPARPERQLKLEGLVDTGALYTQVPRNLVDQIGIQSSGLRDVHYTDGTKDSVPVAKADIAVNGGEAATMVLLSKPGSLIRLGAITLDSLDLGVNHLHTHLIPIEAPVAHSKVERPLFLCLSWRVEARISSAWASNSEASVG